MILSTYLAECLMQRVDFFLRLVFAEAVLNIRIRHYLHNLLNMFVLFVFSTCLTVQVTYAFKHLLPDGDESVGQRAQAGWVLQLRGHVAAEHLLYVETQHKSQETASLAHLTARR